jgi:hypothetical protein
VKAQGRNWKINKALAGEWVQLVPTGQRWMVFYCSTLVREIDPDRRVRQPPVQDLPGHLVN